MKPRGLRRVFLVELWTGLKLVWPLMSGLLGTMLALGLVIGWREGWSVLDAVYFAFVSGLTIGYGDLVPTHTLSRILAIGVGLVGVLLMGIIVAIGVRALEHTGRRHREEQ